MNRLSMTGLFLALLLTADASAKSRAPVTLTAEVGTSSTTLTIKAHRPQLRYEIGVHGAAGLSVIGQADQISKAQVDPSVRHYVVQHSGQGLIAVTLKVGDARNPSTYVLAVRVSPRPPERTPGRIETGEGGERIKVLPGRRR